MIKSAEGRQAAKGRLTAEGSRFRFRLIFTPVGLVFLVAVLAILIRSLLARNSYEILLSSVAALLLILLGIVGAWKSRKLSLMEPGWKPPFPVTANAGEDWAVTGLDERVPLFFRLHFVVRGRFSPAGYSTKMEKGGCPVLAETSVSRGETSTHLPLDFPISGVFHGNGFCRLKDIFGFFSFPCGLTQQRIVNIRSAPCFGKNYHINAQSGAEDRRNKHSSDEELYYMREYTPGDRFRDINWKSSEKIDTLITRISPDNQEKVSRIEVYFRNFGPSGKSSLEALWLLDRAKARLSHFLRSLMEQQSSYVFSVRAAQGSWEIEDQESLDTFLENLAGLSFSAPQNEAAFPAGTGELYVFSTACDTGLHGFIIACNPRLVSLYFVQPAGKEPEKNKEREVMRKRDFPANGCIPLPRWLFSGKIKQMGVQAYRVENIYAETKL
jgi:hypothetical protein